MALETRFPDPVQGAALLEDFVSFLRRFVIVSEAQADAIALWILHGYCIEAALATPYLAITSAEKRSGKSRLLEVLALLVARPLRSAGTTEAALFRSLAVSPPRTLLMDEVDAIFGAKANGNHEDLRALLNSGHRRGMPVLRCVGERNTQVKEFEVFGPKALAGIGALPDTVADRSLPIRLKRRAPSERVERFRTRDAESEAKELCARGEEFAAAHLEELAAARPELPDELDDRAQDACEPLVAIADRAGGCWPDRARTAFVALRGQEQEADGVSFGIRLLADIRQVFGSGESPQLPTEALLEALAAIEESPWGDFYGGGRLSPRRLAGLLRPYGIRPRDLRVDDKALKGYRRVDFVDAFRRYLSPQPKGASAATSRDMGDIPVAVPDTADPTAATSPHPSRIENGSFRLNQADVAHVAASAGAGEPCPYPSHREFDWLTADGRRICGVCHPLVPSPNGVGATEAAR
jgi:hypothetical protein